MFESRKLEKYAHYIVGFAYEQNLSNVKTYLVLNYHARIAFIHYKNFYLNSKSDADIIVKELISQGYRTLNDFVQKKGKILNLKK